MTSNRPLVYVVSGWRDHAWETFIRHTLAQEARGLPYGHTAFFRVGCASGADRMTRQWLRYQQDMQPPWFAGWQLYTADWTTHGRRAGPLRNLSMIKGELDPWGLADKLIGFPQPGVHVEKDSGTWGCAKAAFANGVEVRFPSTDRRAYESR